MNNPLVDYHLHSTCSVDGFSSIADYCRRASELGLVEIGFCEHADFDPRDWGYDYFDYPAFRRQIEAQRERFGGIGLRFGHKLKWQSGMGHRLTQIFADKTRKISVYPRSSASESKSSGRNEDHGRFGRSLAVRAAVEVTYQASREEEIALFLADKHFDYVVGSVHLVEDGADWAMISEAECCGRYFAQRTVQAAYRPYFAELRRAVASGLFDLIGHFDLVKRYGVGYYGPFDPAVFADEIHDILKLMVEKGVGLEINTSGLRQPPRETFPGLAVLKCYRRLGGEVLTVGSDAHSAADLGRGIAQAVALARQAEFRAIALFDERKLRWLDIV